MQNVGRRKEGKYLYTVYLASASEKGKAVAKLKTKYKTVRVKRAGGIIGGPRYTHYAIWCRGAK